MQSAAGCPGACSKCRRLSRGLLRVHAVCCRLSAGLLRVPQAVQGRSACSLPQAVNRRAPSATAGRTPVCGDMCCEGAAC